MSANVKVLDKKVTVKKVTAYQKAVLNPNKKLKETSKTLGGTLKTMYNFATEMGLTADQKAFVQALRKKHESFKSFQKVCRKSVSGNYSPFFVLQTMYAMDKELKKALEEAKAKKAPAKKATVKKATAKKPVLVTA